MQAIDDRDTGLKVLINGQEVDSSKYAIEYSNDYSIKVKGDWNDETLELDINIKVTINTAVHIILEGKCPLILFCR